MQTVFRFRHALPLLLLICALPIRADGVLEQMQNEVAALAAQTRRAVVVIQEDETAVGYVPHYRVSAMRTEPSGKLILQARLAQSYANFNQAQIELDRVTQTYTPHSPAYRSAKKYLETIRLKYDSLQQEVNKTGVLTYIIRRETAGNGFAIGDGYIVTTADVLDGMKFPTVRTDTGARLKAHIVGVDKRLNLGLVQLETKDALYTLTLGDSDTVAAGHFAVSLGNQGRDENTVGFLTIAGLAEGNRTIGATTYPRLLQIAGTVGVGSSGAPLVNVKGEVVGVLAAMTGEENEQSVPVPMQTSENKGQTRLTFRFPNGSSETIVGYQVKGSNTVVFGTSEGRVQFGERGSATSASGLTPNNTVSSAGFAVPINDLKPLIEKLKTGKPLQEGWLGLKTGESEPPPPQTGRFSVTVIRVRVNGVYPGSPAFTAGILPGDELWDLNDKFIGTPADLRRFMLNAQVGDKVNVIVGREGKPVRFTLTVVPRPDIIPSPVTRTGKQIIHDLQAH